jgi:hypothetical protein
VTLEEIEIESRRRQMIDADKKRDAERNMSYVALAGLLAFPLLIIGSSYFGLDRASGLLSDIAGIAYISVSAILGSYFGFNTLSELQNRPSKKD